MRRFLARNLYRLVVLLDNRYDFRATHWTFTYELKDGVKWREDNHGCRVWYRTPDHKFAYDEADTPWANPVK